LYCLNKLCVPHSRFCTNITTIFNMFSRKRSWNVLLLLFSGINPFANCLFHSRCQVSRSSKYFTSCCNIFFWSKCWGWISLRLVLRGLWDVTLFLYSSWTDLMNSNKSTMFSLFCCWHWFLSQILFLSLKQIVYIPPWNIWLQDALF
jgi:hypothetical protein